VSQLLKADYFPLVDAAPAIRNLHDNDLEKRCSAA
jgi:hypothetical protein